MTRIYQAPLKARHFLAIAALVGLGCGVRSLPAALAQDAFLPCAAVADVDQQAAIAAAETWLKARWARGRGAWATAYLVPPAKAAPLGLNRIMAADEPQLGALPSQPVMGVAAAHKMACTSARSAETSAFTVHFTADGLRFHEGRAWSQPLKPILVHALAATFQETSRTWTIADIPDAPTALLPGARLSHPVATDIAMLAPASAAKAVAQDKRAKPRP